MFVIGQHKMCLKDNLIKLFELKICFQQLKEEKCFITYFETKNENFERLIFQWKFVEYPECYHKFNLYY